MKIPIAAPSGYALVRVWTDLTHEVVPVVAFLVDSESTEPVPVPVIAAFDEPRFTGLVFPDGRTAYLGGIYADARNFIAACRRYAALADEELA